MVWFTTTGIRHSQWTAVSSMSSRNRRADVGRFEDAQAALLEQEALHEAALGVTLDDDGDRELGRLAAGAPGPVVGVGAVRAAAALGRGPRGKTLTAQRTPGLARIWKSTRHRRQTCCAGREPTSAAPGCAV